jgi:hypothetical protein
MAGKICEIWLCFLMAFEFPSVNTSLPISLFCHCSFGLEHRTMNICLRWNLLPQKDIKEYNKILKT